MSDLQRYDCSKQRIPEFSIEILIPDSHFFQETAGPEIQDVFSGKKAIIPEPPSQYPRILKNFSAFPHIYVVNAIGSFIENK